MFNIELIVTLIILAALSILGNKMKNELTQTITLGKHSIVTKLLTVTITVLWSLLIASYITDNPELRFNINGWYAIIIIYSFILFKFTHTHYGHHLYSKVTGLSERFNTNSPWMRVGSIDAGINNTTVGQYFGISNCSGEVEIYRHLANNTVVYVTNVQDIMYEKV